MNASEADRIILSGKLVATGGGALRLANPSALPGFALGDKWTLFDLSNGGTIDGSLALDSSSLNLTGSFDPGSGVLSIIP